MTGTNHEDIVDVLLDQHQQLRQLCTDVQASHGDERRLHFAALTRLVNVHELGERTVVHPVTRDHTTGGTPVAEACAVEEEEAGRAVAELEDFGVDHPSFAVKFAAFHQTLLEHAAHEERDEFPRLRQWVPAQRLHLMANELRNVETME